MFKSVRVARSKSATPVRSVFSDETESLPEAQRVPGFRGDVGEATFADGSVLLGLGERAKCSAEIIRKAGAGLVKGLDRMKIKAATIDFDLEPQSIEDIESAAHFGRAIAEGIGLANWKVDFFQGSAARENDTGTPAGTLSISSDDREINGGLKRGLALAESTNYARRIACTPPNICNPTWMAKEARSLARRFETLSCKVIDYAQTGTLGMGGIVNVGKASNHKPCLIQLDYKPKRTTKPARNTTLAIVGKTITYDTGGYSIKSRDGMKGMKYDKCGGMAVLGTMHALASLDVPVRVTALLPTAENMVSGEGYRPDDIIEMYNGVSVEVTNTDAEGRLVLADALAYACDKIKPAAVVDLATLTGGVVIALGSWSAGLFCEHDELRERLEAAAGRSGEKLWRLPLWEPHREFMRAKHADIWNSGPKREAHPIQGAAFLSYFVEQDIPWAHIDIAGTSDVDSDTELFVIGPTGFGVRLMVDFIETYA